MTRFVEPGDQILGQILLRRHRLMHPQEFDGFLRGHVASGSNHARSDPASSANRQPTGSARYRAICGWVSPRWLTWRPTNSETSSSRSCAKTIQPDLSVAESGYLTPAGAAPSSTPREIAIN